MLRNESGVCLRLRVRFSTARARAAGVSGPPPLVVATSYAFWYDGDDTATGCGLPTTAEGCSVLLQSLLCDLRTL
jgi:hypothetical protein